MPDRVRLVVLFGGQSAEHDVSCVSAWHVLRAANRDRYQLEAIGIDRQGIWRQADDPTTAPEAGGGTHDHLSAVGSPINPMVALAPQAGQPALTVVLPVLHGPGGEDGTVQGLLEMANVPFVGAGVLGSALCMDKLKAKDVLAAHGMPQVPWIGLREGDCAEVVALAQAAGLQYPLFVKPANLGSSVGVSRATDEAALEIATALAVRYDEWIVVEESAHGREIEVAVLGNTEPQASVPGEIIPAGDFYDYNDKYLNGAADLIIPADLPPTTSEEIRRLAVAAFTILRVDGMARVDFFYEPDGRGLLINEVNTIPGFTPISMYPKLWAATGVPYDALIDELVRLALDRHARRSRFSTTR